MDVDFSLEARQFLEAHPKEKLEGLSLDERVSKLLEAKARLHNEHFDKKISSEQLETVFNRGQAVTDWVYCASKSNMQWSFARVNKFIYMHQDKKVGKSYRCADRDIAEGELEYETEMAGQGYHDYTDLDFAVARLDLKNIQVSEDESNRKIKGLLGMKFIQED
jgi:hypothetical protein